jgi:hypothetical protein
MIQICNLNSLKLINENIFIIMIVLYIFSHLFKVIFNNLNKVSLNPIYSYVISFNSIIVNNLFNQYK